jgi:hypothetical protein
MCYASYKFCEDLGYDEYGFQYVLMEIVASPPKRSERATNYAVLRAAEPKAVEIDLYFYIKHNLKPTWSTQVWTKALQLDLLWGRCHSLEEQTQILSVHACSAGCLLVHSCL